jgi:23S rRNA (pseudouridine1915-N3)-methyltransferase
MKITLLQLGKTHFEFVDEGFAEFQKRISRYCKFYSEVLVLPTKLKSSQPEVIRKHESDLVIKKILPTDYVMLLDERGKEFSSIAFAEQLQKLFLHHAHLVFIIGGAYGFDEELYNRANFKISLSKMTYSHQLIRLVFAEQLYRAFTIIHHEPYHHE